MTESENFELNEDMQISIGIVTILYDKDHPQYENLREMALAAYDPKLALAARDAGRRARKPEL